MMMAAGVYRISSPPMGPLRQSSMVTKSPTTTGGRPMPVFTALTASPRPGNWVRARTTPRGTPSTSAMSVALADTCSDSARIPHTSESLITAIAGSVRRATTSPGGNPMKVYAAVFVSVLLAELGDKTQLATLAFATDPAAGKLGVFLAAAGALVLSSGLAVLVRAEVGRWIAPGHLRIVAALGFIAIGAWMLLARGW